MQLTINATNNFDNAVATFWAQNRMETRLKRKQTQSKRSHSQQAIKSQANVLIWRNHQKADAIYENLLTLVYLLDDSLVRNMVLSSSFICLVKIKREGGIKFTIMARRPQETIRIIIEATSAVINKKCVSAACSIPVFIHFFLKVKKLDEEVINTWREFQKTLE